MRNKIIALGIVLLFLLSATVGMASALLNSGGGESIPTDGLVAYYPFDGNANDASGNGHHGNEYGDITYVDGNVGEAVQFDGIDDLISVSTTESLRVPYYSVSFWLKTGQNTRAAIFSGLYAHSSVDCNGYETNINHPSFLGKIRGEHMTRATGNWGAFSSNEMTDGNWHHVVTVFDGTISYMYIDGILSGTFDCRDYTHDYFEGPVRWTSPYQDFKFGFTANTLRTGYSMFSGLLDEFRIYNRPLSETEILSLYVSVEPTPTPTITPAPTPAPPTPPSGKIKVVWLYNPDKHDTSGLMTNLKSAGINTIFLSTDVNNIWKYERFVKSAHESGIKVHAMILEDPRCALKENRASAIKAVETVLDYNDKSLAKFDGINIDTEPYVDLDLEQVWQDYITLLEAIHEKTKGKTVLSADIPRWYDEAKIKDLAPNVDFFVIMAYDSGRAGWNTASEIEDAVASEMGAIRGEGSDAVIGIGVQEGFKDKGAVEKCVDELYSYYSGDPAFLGVPIFKYESYLGLASAPEVTVPTGEEVTPTPGFGVGFAIAGLLAVAYVLRRKRKWRL